MKLNYRKSSTILTQGFEIDRNRVARRDSAMRHWSVRVQIPRYSAAILQVATDQNGVATYASSGSALCPSMEVWAYSNAGQARPRQVSHCGTPYSSPHDLGGVTMGL